MSQMHGGDSCRFYYENPNRCGSADSEVFQAGQLCCPCGGGLAPTKFPSLEPTSPTIQPNESPPTTFPTSCPSNFPSQFCFSIYTPSACRASHCAWNGDEKKCQHHCKINVDVQAFYEGEDSQFMNLVSIDFYKCEKVCLEHERCLEFSFNKVNNTCKLYSQHNFETT